MVLICAVIAGCGESAEDRYGDEFTEVARPLQSELIALGNAVGSSSSRAPISAALGRADDALDTTAAGFEELDPPDDVNDLEEELLAAIADFRAEIETTREALRSGSNDEASKAVGDFRVASQRFADQLGDIGQRLEDADVPLGEPATTEAP